MRKLQNLPDTDNPYTKRILSNILGKDPLKIYSQTPRKIKRLVAGLGEKQLSMHPGKGKWSIKNIICHLCDSELAMSFRIRKAIAEPGSNLQAYDQDEWVKHLHYEKLHWKEALVLLNSLRQSNISLIRLLSARELQRYGIHEERGKETVERMIQLLAGHDVNHIRQIQKLRGEQVSS